MILPSTYGAALLLVILSMLCWGSWANTFKLTGKWRFELFYFDFAGGVLLAAVVAALTFGSAGSELSFTDNLLITGKTQLAWAFGAGVLFNLANMLLVAAISIGGMALAFPIAIGLALLVGAGWSRFLNPQGNLLLLTAGVVLVGLAIIVDASAYTAYSKAKRRMQEPPAAPPAGEPGEKRRRKTNRTRGLNHKGVFLSVISGLLMGSFYPMLEMGRAGENGLGPYALSFVFAIGAFVSTFVLNLYFMNLPVQGESVGFGEYFRGTFRQHALGVCGGIVWCAGTIANFVASSAPNGVMHSAVAYAIGQGAAIIGALWGLLAWREFAGAVGRVNTMVAAVLVLLVAGVVLVSMSPS